MPGSMPACGECRSELPGARDASLRVEMLARWDALGARDVPRARVDRIRSAGKPLAVASVDQHLIGGGQLVDIVTNRSCSGHGTGVKVTGGRGRG